MDTLTREQQIISLVKAGMSAAEVTEALGYKSTTTIYAYCKRNGVSIVAKKNQHKAMRAYKAEGHTMGEVAEKFGVHKGTATQICKGIAPQIARSDTPRCREAHRRKVLDDNQVKEFINERLGGRYIEYCGNYTGSDGTVDLRCKKCGEVFTRACVTVRHGSVVCDVCRDMELKAAAEEKERIKKARREQKEINKQRRNRGRKVVSLLKRVEKLHKCPVCGVVTDNPAYCSVECRKKANNQNKEAKRRIKIAEAMVDKGITLFAVYEKNNGICALCGEPCDWEDHKIENGNFITGNSYPTVDHIVPLAKGGEHSWDNVQLAHFICNSVKGARRVG